MKLIIFCLYREKDRLDRTISALVGEKNVIVASGGTLVSDIGQFEKLDRGVLIISRSVGVTGFNIHTKAEILFSEQFPGGADRLQATARIKVNA